LGNGLRAARHYRCAFVVRILLDEQIGAGTRLSHRVPTLGRNRCVRYPPGTLFVHKLHDSVGPRPPWYFP
jgi:hypothetical protein